MASEQRGDGPITGPMTGEETAREWAKTAEELSKGLPPPSLLPLPEAQASDLSKYKNQPPLTAEDAWQKCADAMRKYDRDSCNAYREELDTLLVFAGLFSAVVTAFTIESYQWLQSDPNDAIIALLAQIADAGNGTQTAPVPKGLPDAVSMRINVYWFLSLTLSLAAALTAILCKQWVRAFERHADQSHEQFISVRQMKLEGFESWDVDGFVANVPVLLQSALGLFAVGMIELLWNLHRTVAIVVLVPAAVALAFYLFTTLLPGLQVICSPFNWLRYIPQCPFKSPQAMLSLRILLALLALASLSYIVLESLVNFLYRKCLVFYRRSRACWQPEGLPSSPDQIEARTLWQRLLRPWRCDEEAFYDWYEDGLTLRDVGRWLRNTWYFIFCCGKTLEQDEESESSSTSDHSSDRDQFPTLEAIESWLALDLEYTKLKDSVYTLAEYRDYQVSPPFYFRAFEWLHHHVYQPGMKSWTWMCVWDMAMKIEQSTPLVEVDVLRMRQGVLAISPISHERLPVTSRPCAMALVYGLSTDIEPALVAEAFINLLPTLDIATAERLYSWIIEKLGDDPVWMYSMLHAILSLQLTSTAENEDDEGSNTIQDIRPLLLTAAHAAPHHPRSHAQCELPCIVALYFRELRAHGPSGFAVYEDLNSLLVAAIKTFFAELGSDCGHEHAAPPAEQRMVFAELARAVDLEFECLRERGPREDGLDRWSPQEIPFYLLDYRAAAVAERLARPAYRRVYLDLLADGAPDIWGALEARFERNIASLARRPRRSRSSGGGSQRALNAQPSGFPQDASVRGIPAIYVHAPEAGTGGLSGAASASNGADQTRALARTSHVSDPLAQTREQPIHQGGALHPSAERGTGAADVPARAPGAHEANTAGPVAAEVLHAAAGERSASAASDIRTHPATTGTARLGASPGVREPDISAEPAPPAA